MGSLIDIRRLISVFFWINMEILIILATFIFCGFIFFFQKKQIDDLNQYVGKTLEKISEDQIKYMEIISSFQKDSLDRMMCTNLKEYQAIKSGKKPVKETEEKELDLIPIELAQKQVKEMYED